MRRALLSAVVSGGLMLAVVVWPAAADVPPPVTPPASDGGSDAASEPLSLVQVCAATSVEQVDGLLAGVVGSELAGGLRPILGLTVPDSDTLRLGVAVTLGDVRDALGCDPAPTTTPTPAAPSTTAAPTTPAAPPAGDFTGLACEDFTDRGEAQAILDAGRGDRAKLDPDGDGIACETGGQVQVHPQGGVDAGGWPR